MPRKQEIIECACGCGEKIEKYDSQWRSKKYFKGHGKYKSPEEAIKSKIKINENGCWEWQGYKLSHSGHGQIRFRNKTYLAHRFSYEYFKGPINDKYVCHKCNNSCCVNPDHLYLGTQHDNMKDAVKAGTAIFNRIHSDKMIIEIRNLFKNGIKQKDIAKKFNVSPSWISRVVRFKKRKNIVTGGD